MANHKDVTMVFGNQIITVKAGSFITSKRKLAMRWRWSNTKVGSFLKLLESDKMIVVKSDTKKTLITIENYGFYQSDEGRKTSPKRHQNVTETSPKRTNNNDNNDNNVNKESINTLSIPPKVEDVASYCLERGNGIDANDFISFYESKGWMIGKNKMKDWKASIRTWESKRGFKKKDSKPIDIQKEEPTEMTDEEWLRMMKESGDS